MFILFKFLRSYYSVSLILEDLALSVFVVLLCHRQLTEKFLWTALPLISCFRSFMCNFSSSTFFFLKRLTIFMVLWPVSFQCFNSLLEIWKINIYIFFYHFWSVGTHIPVTTKTNFLFVTFFWQFLLQWQCDFDIKNESLHLF